ncbi:alpha/beta fold hydrolase [Paractinoplanes atraurantiacus]|uniref:Pimeloyl-ACP methyl ester carboxylesterase n=1 Tax=Paractinoplanes atraurantiacus TaxID=1036182 RepID=A0A285JM57_9ACTN|nr:alpha/beta hydrolase [Actinoplanes atraurantiacus]SNY61392.1 Pimeloyl-ACP methyl ester carboxylesterase [Actinoplanes atraurantiacus]
MDQVDAGVLSVAYLRDGPPDGWPVILSHGFPYDVHAYDRVVPALTAHGALVIRPYLRGFGPTRFRSAGTVRSGQQAALGSDLVALADALRLDRPIVAGYDWGGLASCVAAALWPQRVSGLVSLAGYDIIDIERQRHAFDPSVEHAVWYQHLFQTERGRATLAAHRRDLCRMLWRQWSPQWAFDEETYAATAPSFDNPDFVDVVIHAYRHALGQTTGDPAYDDLEARLTTRPKITVPAVTLDGATDTLKPGGTADHAPMFTAAHEHRLIDAGHNLPQEAPKAFADAILTVRAWRAW